MYKLVKDISNHLYAHQYKSVLYGKCVRNIILGRESNVDSNFTYNMLVACSAPEVKGMLKDMHLSYDVVCNNDSVCISEPDSHNVIVNIRCINPKSDIHFESIISNVNMSIDAFGMDMQTGKILDPLGNIDVEHNILLRFVGSQSELEKAITDMPELAVLYLTIAVCNKMVMFDKDTATVMINALKNARALDREYVTKCLREMLTCGNEIKNYFSTYREIVSKMIPDLAVCFDFNQNNKYHQHDVWTHLLYVTDNCTVNKFEVKLAALLHDIGKPNTYSVDENGHGHFYGHPKESGIIASEIFNKYLSLSEQEKELTIKLIKLHDFHVTDNFKAVRSFLLANGEDFFNDWIVLKAADLQDHINLDTSIGYLNMEEIRALLKEVLFDEHRFKLKDMKVNGSDVMQLTDGKPGKHIGEILNSLFNDILEFRVLNDRNMLLERIAEIWNTDYVKNQQ